ncbi:hypothetical protein TNCV_2186641 [Trichonephila clavipes]|nr:hypothetical protein TNCV_2186641 [Trichonephila clavipes]
MHCLPPNDVSVFAEEANQFALNETNNFRMAEKKKRSVNIQFLNSVMKDITPFRQKNKRKKSSSPESLHGAQAAITSPSWIVLVLSLMLAILTGMTEFERSTTYEAISTPAFKLSASG